MKTVGRRTEGPTTWADADQLQRTMAAMRGTPCLVPRGVHRFKSFEEAERWLIETIARTHASLASKTSRASVAR